MSISSNLTAATWVKQDLCGATEAMKRFKPNFYTDVMALGCLQRGCSVGVELKPVSVSCSLALVPIASPSSTQQGWAAECSGYVYGRNGSQMDRLQPPQPEMAHSVSFQICRHLYFGFTGRMGIASTTLLILCGTIALVRCLFRNQVPPSLCVFPHMPCVRLTRAFLFVCGLVGLLLFLLLVVAFLFVGLVFFPPWHWLGSWLFSLIYLLIKLRTAFSYLFPSSCQHRLSCEPPYRPGEVSAPCAPLPQESSDN